MNFPLSKGFLLFTLILSSFALGDERKRAPFNPFKNCWAIIHFLTAREPKASWVREYDHTIHTHEDLRKALSQLEGAHREGEKRYPWYRPFAAGRAVFETVERKAALMRSWVHRNQISTKPRSAAQFALVPGGSTPLSGFMKYINSFPDFKTRFYFNSMLLDYKDADGGYQKGGSLLLSDEAIITLTPTATEFHEVAHRVADEVREQGYLTPYLTNVHLPHGSTFAPLNTQKISLEEIFARVYQAIALNHTLIFAEAKEKARYLDELKTELKRALEIASYATVQLKGINSYLHNYPVVGQSGILFSAEPRFLGHRFYFYDLLEKEIPIYVTVMKNGQVTLHEADGMFHQAAELLTFDRGERWRAQFLAKTPRIGNIPTPAAEVIDELLLTPIRKSLEMTELAQNQLAETLAMINLAAASESRLDFLIETANAQRTLFALRNDMHRLLLQEVPQGSIKIPSLEEMLKFLPRKAG